MFDFKDKKSRFCLYGAIVSCTILLIVFYATDGLLGDKEFSEYTLDDWKVAIVPLAILAVSAVSTLFFAFAILVPMIWKYPALIIYVTRKKFSDIDSGTTFLAFDHNEFKRACCRPEIGNGLWISIKEYDLNTRTWKVLEEGRNIENANNLNCVLRKEYQYDRVKIYRVEEGH